MTRELLKKGFALTSRIEWLKSEIAELNNVLESPEFYFKIKSRRGYDYNFKDDFLPDDFNKFIIDYLKRMDDEIAQLEKELSEL